MASRKEQKEAARQRRLAEERTRQERAARERQLRMLGGVLLVAVAIIAAAIAISSGGGSSATGLQKGSAKNATDNQVASFLAGIPQSGNVLGNPKAPVTMTYFGDLECPVCQAFTLGNDGGGWPQFVTTEVKTGKVKVVYNAFETATQDPNVFKTQQAAALAAGQQSKFWNFAELFYHEQGAEGSGYVNSSYLTGLASQIPGFNVTAWQNARNASSLSNEVVSQINNGTAHGVTGTPTLIITGPKGSVQPSDAVPGYSELAQDVKQVS
ncbi:MAG TPA: thioredoxin domain-containing protein [Solirubrobacteraceae bacterium]|jgi:protein-disulfide isomerase|nr:thioredoxin domain-containing protein [Solirubrobacteraceae bacterium]